MSINVFPPTLIYEIIDKYMHIDLENLCSHQWGPLSLDKIDHDEILDIIDAE